MKKRLTREMEDRARAAICPCKHLNCKMHREMLDEIDALRESLKIAIESLDKPFPFACSEDEA